MELRSGVLAGHGKRCANLARKVAVTMGLPEDEVQDILWPGCCTTWASWPLPDSIMSKPVGKLTPEELASYQRHPVLGAQAFMALDDHQTVATLIRTHHERFDGTGYPTNFRARRFRGRAHPGGGGYVRRHDARAPHRRVAHGSGSAHHLAARARHAVRPEVVDVFLHITQEVKPKPVRIEPVSTDHLKPGMALGKDLLSKGGDAAVCRACAQRRHDQPHSQIRDGRRIEPGAGHSHAGVVS